MKYLGLVLSLSFIFNLCGFAGAQDFKNEQDKISYSIGYQLGSDFKHQGMEIKPEIVVKGVQDALSGTEPLMTQQEMRTALMEAQKKAQAALEEQRKQQASENLAKGKEFLTENGKKEGVKTMPSGLQYKIIKEGDGKKPQENDSVTVQYRGKLIDGKEFDSSYKRNEPARFQVNQVIKGWTEALKMMKEGSRWELFIPPDLAYGDKGAGSRIPPNSTLIFEIELISVEPAKSPQKGS